MTELALKYGLSFADLYERDGLVRLDRKAESDLLVDLSPHLEDFIGGLFGIAGEVRALQARHERLAPLYSVKRLFVQRRAVKEVKEADALQLNGHLLALELEPLIGGPPMEFPGDFATRQG